MRINLAPAAEASLFSPVNVGSLRLANRIVMAPMTRSRADADRLPSPLAPTYYGQRASAGLIITEATQISAEAAGYPRIPGIYNEAQVTSWRAVVDAVHARGGKVVLPSNSPDWVGAIFGIVSGFTSQIAHAGSPPYQMWVLPKRLPRDVLVGTTALAFAAMNWMKVPAYAALGQFTRANLMATAMLAPVALISTLLGVALVRRIDQARFYTLIYLLMVLLGGKLMVDAVAG